MYCPSSFLSADPRQTVDKFLDGSVALENPYAGAVGTGEWQPLPQPLTNPRALRIFPYLYFDPSFNIFVGIIIDEKVAKIYRPKYLKQIRYKY